MFGRGRGHGRRNRGNGGRGRPDMLEKECICPECKTVTSQKRGVPCYMAKCPKCGSSMMGRLNLDSNE